MSPTLSGGGGGGRTATTNATTTTATHTTSSSSPINSNQQHSLISATSTSLFDDVATELSAILSPNHHNTTLQYPTLQALMIRAGCSSLAELQQLSDDEFRQLTRSCAHYTLLQHATAWHERQRLLLSSSSSQPHQHHHSSHHHSNGIHRRSATSSPNHTSTEASNYSLEVMSRQTDLSLEELIQLDQEEFVELSKQVLQNGTLHHAKVYMEYTDAKKNQNSNHNSLWFRSCTANNNNNNNKSTTSTTMMTASAPPIMSCEEFCCGVTGGISTNSNGSSILGASGFRSTSPPTTTRKWSELGF